MNKKILDARIKGICAFGLTAALAFGGPARAQVTGKAEDTSNASGQLEEIVVTTQRFAQDLQSVPVAVSAFSAKTLDDRQITNVKDSAAQIPGILIETTTGVSDGARIFIRGIGQMAATPTAARSRSIRGVPVSICKGRATSLTETITASKRAVF